MSYEHGEHPKYSMYHNICNVYVTKFVLVLFLDVWQVSNGRIPLLGRTVSNSCHMVRMALLSQKMWDVSTAKLRKLGFLGYGVNCQGKFFHETMANCLISNLCIKGISQNPVSLYS